MFEIDVVEIENWPGFYQIAGFPNYAISPTGVVINHITGRTIAVRYLKPAKTTIVGGYPYVQVYDQHHICRIRPIHRLLCLTFKKIPVGIDKPIVNHLDGDPKNFALDNLEWTTYSENTKHAYRTGLYKVKQSPVEVRQRDGSVKRYRSVAECAKSTGISDATLYSRLQRVPGVPDADGTAVKYAGIGDWVVERKIQVTAKIPVKCRNLRTGEVIHFERIAEAARVLELVDDSIRLAMRRKHNPLHGGYEFKYAYDNTPWGVYSPEQIRLHELYPHGKYPLRVIATHLVSGEVQDFESALHAIAFFGRSPGHILKTANANGIIGNYRLSTATVLSYGQK